jgi:hypothetical protein
MLPGYRADAERICPVAVVENYRRAPLCRSR